MTYLLDTSVISELARPEPNQRLLAWFRRTPNHALHVSVLTLGEIRKGIESHEGEARKESLRVWLEDKLTPWFEERLLPIDAAVADRWGRLQAQAGRPIAPIDGLIAATALHHDLRLVTRNISDFPFPGLQLVNPWQG